MDIPKTAVPEVPPEIHPAVTDLIQQLSLQFEIVQAILFGSWARGTPDEDSDVDVAIILKGEREDTLKTAFAMIDVSYDIELETGLNLAPYPIWESDWDTPEHHSNFMLIRNIKREGIPLKLGSPSSR